MDKKEEKVQRVLMWRENFEKMDESLFFDIIHMYLGELKTPYNKQKLMEELSSFLRKPENQQNIIKLLDSKDLQYLIAIKELNRPTLKTLKNFFSEDYELNERLLNLQHRLLIVKYNDEQNHNQFYFINPLLDDALNEYLTLDFILEKEVLKDINLTTNPLLTPEYVAALLCYINNHNEMCKNDFSIKKKNLSELDEIFGEENRETFSALLNSFINLGLLEQTEEGIFINNSRLESFTKLDYTSQVLYLVINSVGKFTRPNEHFYANMIINLMAFMKNDCFKLKTVLQASYFIKQQNLGGETSNRSSRFQEILTAASPNATNNANNEFLEEILTNGILFGLFSFSSEKEIFIKVNEKFLNYHEREILPNAINIQSNFTISLMPGLSLESLIKLVLFLEIKKYDTVSTFEINKKSVMKGLNSISTNIKTELEKYSRYDLPQNISVSLEEWISSYNSVKLYKGYVLKFSEDSKVIIKENPLIKPYLIEELAPNIYLMNFENETQLKEVLKKIDLDFVSQINTTGKIHNTLGFTNINTKNPNTLEILHSEKQLSSIKEKEEFLSSLLSKLDEMELTPEQKQGLQDRINQKIIVNEEQLRSESVKFELLQAYGMDFIGKLHIIETSIKKECFLEIQLYNDKEISLIKPLAIIKIGDNQFLRFAGLDKVFKETATFDVQISNISYIKMIKSLIGYKR